MFDLTSERLLKHSHCEYIGAIISLVGTVAKTALSASSSPDTPDFPHISGINVKKTKRQAHRAGLMQLRATRRFAAQQYPELYGAHGANQWIGNELADSMGGSLSPHLASQISGAGLDVAKGSNSYDLSHQLGLQPQAMQSRLSSQIATQEKLNPEVFTDLTGSQLASAIAADQGNQNTISLAQSSLATAQQVNQAAQQGNIINAGLSGALGAAGLMTQHHAQYGSPYLQLGTFQQGNVYNPTDMGTSWNESQGVDQAEPTGYGYGTSSYDQPVVQPNYQNFDLNTNTQPPIGGTNLTDPFYYGAPFDFGG